MPIVIVLLILIVLLLGGWWIFAVALGSALIALGAVLAAIIWFVKTVWPYALFGSGALVALGCAWLLVEEFKTRDARRRFKASSQIRAPTALEAVSRPDERVAHRGASSITVKGESRKD